MPETVPPVPSVGLSSTAVRVLGDWMEAMMLFLGDNRLRSSCVHETERSVAIANTTVKDFCCIIYLFSLLGYFSLCINADCEIVLCSYKDTVFHDIEKRINEFSVEKG